MKYLRPSMLRASSIRTRTRLALIAAAALALALPALGGKNDAKMKEAKQAEKDGRLDKAEQIYCEVAASDKEDLDAQQLCTNYRLALPGERRKNEQRFADGKDAMAKGDLETARQKFQNIKWGDRFNEAQGLIAQLNQSAGDEAAFTAGVNAFNSNDIAGADAQFSKIKGAKAGEAAPYLTKIRTYRANMQNGQEFMQKRDYPAAAQAFNGALGIRSTNEARAALENANSQLARTQQTTTVATKTTEPTTITPTPATTTTSTPRPGLDKNMVLAPRTDATKAVQFAFTAADAGRLLKEAEAAMARNDAATAKSKIAQVLVVEKKGENATKAKDMLDQLAASATGRKQEAGAEADDMLINGIQEYYQGKYDDAADDLRTYIRMKGRKAALANFYRVRRQVDPVLPQELEGHGAATGSPRQLQGSAPGGRLQAAGEVRLAADSRRIQEPQQPVRVCGKRKPRMTRGFFHGQATRSPMGLRTAWSASPRTDRNPAAARSPPRRPSSSPSGCRRSSGSAWSAAHSARSKCWGRYS